jgi:nucleoside-diphosphate-sugar epimerase
MRALVTGGGGFLGLAIVRRLLSRGDVVRSLSRTRHPQLDALNVEQMHGDVADAGAVAAAAAGCDIVFHVAAKAGIWGPYREYYQMNVVGTENVLAACRRHGIRRLVYTSSPSVVFSGHDQEAMGEAPEYPASYLAHYPATKALAERAVIAANGADLATVALRPHLIWGPGDNHLIPRLIERARQGRLRRVGSGRNRVDTIFIDNAADAHVLAADRLAPGSPLAGRTYFLSNGEPVNLWDFINRILDAAGLPPVTRSMPASVAYAAGVMFEVLYRALGRESEPPMTRFLARQLSTSHWFDISPARRDFGYCPGITIDEGLGRLRRHLASSQC